MASKVCLTDRQHANIRLIELTSHRSLYNGIPHALRCLTLPCGALRSSGPYQISRFFLLSSDNTHIADENVLLRGFNLRSLVLGVRP
jgi:hypothetical protein